MQLLIFPPSFHGKKGFEQVHVFGLWVTLLAVLSLAVQQCVPFHAFHRGMRAGGTTVCFQLLLLLPRTQHGSSGQRRGSAAPGRCAAGMRAFPGSDPIAHINYKKPGRAYNSNRVELHPDE